MNNKKHKSPRREFLGKIAAGAAALGLLSIPSSVKAAPALFDETTHDADEFFKKIKGKHRIMFDAPKPNGLYPFVWPKVFLLTNAATGTPEKDNNVVVVLRHEAIPYAFENSLWTKYKFGDMFKVDDPRSKATAVSNPFWKPKVGDYQVPGFGNVAIGINELQDSGVMFVVCNAAMTVYSAVVAQQMKMNAADVLKEWTAGVLPGVQIVPSGVWAVGRAQEHGCAYCFAG
ncbi:MAG: twin-arginine translocation signal domain-containing protein [Bacteroidota bacterium]|nr:twin-arginine translocation signal domain-containing protein [Bacteroidota bacterium]